MLDGKTIGHADVRGNLQYISVGNLQGNERVALLLMDYAGRRRLKILGRARLLDADADPAWQRRLVVPDYRARVRLRRRRPRRRAQFSVGSVRRRSMARSRNERAFCDAWRPSRCSRCTGSAGGSKSASTVTRRPSRKASATW